MNCVRMNGKPSAAPPEDLAVVLRQHDPLQAHGARLDDDADHCEQERKLVRDELPGGAQRSEQRELVRARPAGHQDADHREARHRERVEHAHVEVLDDHVGPRRDHEEDEEGGDHDDRRREREDAPVGLGGHDVFLLDELDAVADELEPAMEPTGIHRAQPALHVAHDLQQERVPEDQRAERHERQDDDRLQRECGSPPDLERERHRSMSPRMK